MSQMTITQRQTGYRALRRLLGYSPHAPAWPVFVSCAPVSLDFLKTIHAANDAHDIVHVIFSDEGSNIEPASISVLTQQGRNLEWLPDCRLYAASHWAPIELLADGRRWFVGPGDVLAPSKMPPANRRAKGAALAMNRWRRAVDKMAMSSPGASAARHDAARTANDADDNIAA